jgi:hypothetical protein
MPGLLPNVDPDGLLEFSVVYTDRALNHMSARFRGVMTDISAILKEVYHAKAAVLVPGSGTFGMESVARQFAHGKKVLVIRNGWFSYRWTQIFDMGAIPSESIVLKARRTGDSAQAPWEPCPVEEVVATIRAEKPAVVFAPHVETAAGMILPDDYIRAVTDAVHEVGGLFVLDCIASGAMWVNMEATGVDLLISAPQKGWSGSPACAMVMLSERARAAIDGTTSSSFACDLKKWLQIMESYETAAIRTTPPCLPMRWPGCATCHARRPQATASRRCVRNRLPWVIEVRALLRAVAYESVAAEGFQAPRRGRQLHRRSRDPEQQKVSGAWGCKPPRVCPCSVTSRPVFRPFASACSGLRNCTTSTAASTNWPLRWTRWVSLGTDKTIAFDAR